MRSVTERVYLFEQNHNFATRPFFMFFLHPKADKTQTGETQTGYIPKTYVTSTSGNAPVSNHTYGETVSKTDAYGRLIYLLLGGAAICVLTDFLILRRFRNKENEQ